MPGRVAVTAVSRIVLPAASAIPILAAATARARSTRPCPTTPSSASTETLRLLNYLNNALPGPAFRLDPDDGDIVFRHCVHLGTDAKLDPRPFNDALALCRVALDRDLPQIATVALGQCTFAATLAARRQTVSEN